MQKLIILYNIQQTIIYFLILYYILKMIENKQIIIDGFTGFLMFAGLSYLTEKNKDKDYYHKIAAFAWGAHFTFFYLMYITSKQGKKAANVPNITLADFVAPKHSGREDYIGAFVVTAGVGIDEHIARFEADHDDYNSIMLKALADRLAEAFAEKLHHEVRKEYWGFSKDEVFDNEEFIKEKYRGIRPAAGYPACPDHSEKETIFRLLDAEKLGITLTESYAMLPTAAVSGLYFANENSKYFGLGKVQKDQMEDYAQRKGKTIEACEKWLRPNLNY